MHYDVIVIGGSAAGLAATLYASRQGLKTLVITKDIGGQMLLTNEIQNYPGFANTSGFELATKFKEQVELYGPEFVYDEANGIERDAECPGLCFRVKTMSGDYHATALILAFGKTPKDLGVPGEQELKGKGVSYCAVCDGPLFKGKTVAVVGTGDQALEAANYLASVVSKIYLIHTHDRPIGSEDLVSQVLSLPNVQAVPNSKVSALKGTSKLETIIITNTTNGQNSEIQADGIFVEIGYIAKTAWLKDLVKLTPQGQIEVDRKSKTSQPGIFAAGDVTDIPYMQAVISAGQGAIAALSAYNYVQGIKGKTATRADWRAIKVQTTK